MKKNVRGSKFHKNSAHFISLLFYYHRGVNLRMVVHTCNPSSVEDQARAFWLQCLNECKTKTLSQKLKTNKYSSVSCKIFWDLKLENGYSVYVCSLPQYLIGVPSTRVGWHPKVYNSSFKRPDTSSSPQPLVHTWHAHKYTKVKKNK